MTRVAVDPRQAGPTLDFISLSPSTTTSNLPRRHKFSITRSQSSKWTSALRAQIIVVRNAVGSIACTWLANAFYSLGNIFSRKPSRNQSRRELIAANSAWASITFFIITLLSQVPVLLLLKFIDAPDRRPTLGFCLKKLVRATAFYYLVALTIMVSWGSFVGYLTTEDPSLFKYKLDCHINTLATHGMLTGITLTTKKIYYRESCQGRDRLALAQQKLEAPAKTLPSPTTQVPLSVRKRNFSFWRAYIKEFPNSVPAAVAGTFVIVLSQQRVMDQSNAIITCFVIASIVLKFTIQETIKHYISKKRIRSIRVMCVAVALPTVLIDTQTRIILLGTQSSHLLALGTFGMAVLEISMRYGKAHFIQRTIRNREAKIPVRRKSTAISSQPQPRGKVAPHAPRPSRVDFELWRARTQAFHVAEIIADTYAEYIAIGCSASILVFFGNHPHYSLLRKVGQNRQPPSHLPMLVFQLVVQVVVDFVATGLEMAAGVEFDMDKNVAAFLAVFLAATAVLNINISVGVYLS